MLPDFIPQCLEQGMTLNRVAWINVMKSANDPAKYFAANAHTVWVTPSN